MTVPNPFWSLARFSHFFILQQQLNVLFVGGVIFFSSFSPSILLVDHLVGDALLFLFQNTSTSSSRKLKQNKIKSIEL
jgi:hypothetical protein